MSYLYHCVEHFIWSTTLIPSLWAGAAWFTKYTSGNLTNLSTVISRKLQLKLLIQFLAELTLNSVI